MLTPEELQTYRRSWQEHKKETARRLAERHREARQKAHAAAHYLKQNYPCRVFLFGSLLNPERFGEYSDIDLAISGLPDHVNFWQLYYRMMEILSPFDFDLIELENVTPEVREYIIKKGLEL